MAAETRKSPARWAAMIFAALLGLIGLALIVGGVQLAALGGSWYYLVTGSLVAACAVLHVRGGVWADRLYALMLVFTLLWALWEASAEPWSLVARLLGPAALGLCFFGFRSAPLSGSRADSISLSGAASIFSVVLVAASFLMPGAFGDRPTSSLAPSPPAQTAPDDTDWLNYGNTPRGVRFSPLTQINPGNVRELEVAWIHRAGVPQGPTASNEATPLKVGDALYTCTPHSIVIAINARTGKELWRHDPHTASGDYALLTCRGVSYYRSGMGGVCAERIFVATIDARLMALDARSGRPCADFGRDGTISLLDGLGDVSATYQYSSSPPTIVSGHIVVGGFVLDNQSNDMPSGVIRSFDPIKGALQWAWDMGAPDRIGAPPPGETYTRSTPNAWAPFAADETLGLVYVPTGNPSPDFFGGQRRPFDETYGSSVVALDLATGRPRWSFQTVHHDLWDYDVPAQPVLIDLPREGGSIPALVQATKQGDIYVLDRRTGTPIFPVTERAVPQSGAPGERLSPTQPFSALSVATAPLTEASMWGLTPIDQMMCRILFRQSRYDGMYTPPGLKPTIQAPGLTGELNWGSVSVDEDRKIVVANSLHFPWRVRLVPRASVTPEVANARWSPMMVGTPYAWEQGSFFGPLQVPCVEPPWGNLTAIDLNTQTVLWRRTLGTGQDSGPFGIPSMLPLPMGVPSSGGTVTTRGGLIFISGTLDRYVRAFDLGSGAELWKMRLPAGGQATPMTYMAGGRQYLVVTAGGHSLMGTKTGDYTIGYALPTRD